jgi:hypothetical protein
MNDVDDISRVIASAGFRFQQRLLETLNNNLNAGIFFCFPAPKST